MDGERLLGLLLCSFKLGCLGQFLVCTPPVSACVNQPNSLFLLYDVKFTTTYILTYKCEHVLSLVLSLFCFSLTIVYPPPSFVMWSL